jgi:hypothetical protein
MRRADIEVPNFPAAVGARGKSACYPRGNFYPLIDGPSMRYHRFTKPDFRPCFTCPCRSQATFYLYALCAISDRAEVTFGRLRYILGGDRPSQTTHQTLSPQGVRRSNKPGWYFTVVSTKPKSLASMTPTYATQVSPNANIRL